MGVGDLSADHFLVSNWFKLLAVTLGSILKTRKCLISLPFWKTLIQIFRGSGKEQELRYVTNLLVHVVTPDIITAVLSPALVDAPDSSISGFPWKVTGLIPTLFSVIALEGDSERYRVSFCLVVQTDGELFKNQVLFFSGPWIMNIDVVLVHGSEELAADWTTISPSLLKII